MSCARACKLCPHAVFLRPRFDVYRARSAEIREIFQEYTDIVEPLSLDEAFLDVTDNKKGMPFATEIAKYIREKIYEKTGTTASAGIFCPDAVIFQTNFVPQLAFQFFFGFPTLGLTSTFCPCMYLDTFISKNVVCNLECPPGTRLLRLLRADAEIAAGIRHLPAASYFDERLLREIENAPNFILILSSGVS